MVRINTFALISLACLPAFAQTHKVAAPQKVTRAVGVYEWTGDFQKPAASRLVPITLFIDGQYQDASLYLARPVPLALDTDTVYELEEAGVPKGLFDLEFAKHLIAADNSTGFDDGWTGYGKWRNIPPPPKPKKVIQADLKEPADDSRPHFGSRPKPDSDDNSKSDSKDRPSFGKPAPRDEAPADDPDRPTLKKRSSSQKKQSSQQDTSSVGGSGDLNDDPNRPKLKRGVPPQQLVMPELKGISISMKQMVAVSDATSRAEHDFSLQWQDANEKSAILAKMEKIARGLLPASTAAPAPAAAKSPATAHSMARRAHIPGTTPAAPAEIPFVEEKLSAYELSYNGSPTYVFQAQTAQENEPRRYVTVVAQADTFGEPQVAIKQVTDASHFDQIPWMRFVDVVDADASERASVLMELRSQNSRQFALYRVISGQATRTYLSGSTE